jgi:hypothetical protein
MSFGHMSFRNMFTPHLSGLAPVFDGALKEPRQSCMIRTSAASTHAEFDSPMGEHHNQP